MKLCELELQAFIDCMFVNSMCVQSGSNSFEKCVDEELKTNRMYSECAQRYLQYITCWKQLVPLPVLL